MCTAISTRSKGFYFGRTMDIERSFGERAVTVPRYFPLPEIFSKPLTCHYAVTGMAAIADGYPLFADGFNETGLCMAALSFPESASYANSPVKGKINLSPFELIPHILGTCKDLGSARDELKQINLTDASFREDIPTTPLHWIVADESGSLTVEPLKDELMVYENPIGVLTNEPPFPFHRTNARLFEHLSPEDSELQPFGHGFRALGLPGDWSSPSRFIRAAFIVKNAPPRSEDEQGRVAHFFDILSSVAPPKGAVITNSQESHFTHYACCMNPLNGIYYTKRYGKLSIEVHTVGESRKEGSSLIY